MKELQVLEKSSVLRQKAIELQKFLRKQQKAQYEKHKAALQLRDQEIHMLKQQVATQQSAIDCLRNETEQLQSQLQGRQFDDHRKTLLSKFQIELRAFQKNAEEQRVYFERLEREKHTLINDCFTFFEKFNSVDLEPSPSEPSDVSPSVQNPPKNKLLEDFQFQMLSKEFLLQYQFLLEEQIDTIQEAFPSAIGFLRQVPVQKIDLNLIQEYFTLPTTNSRDNPTLLKIVKEMQKISQSGEGYDLLSRDSVMSLSRLSNLQDLSSSLSEFSEFADHSIASWKEP